MLERRWTRTLLDRTIALPVAVVAELSPSIRLQWDVGFHVAFQAICCIL
jgi:hypothetical protein